MEKKMISVHAVTIHAYTIAIALLLAALVFLSLKYVHLKLALHGFTESTITMNDRQANQPASSITDYADIIATSITQYPQSKTASSDTLQTYIATLSRDLKRDIVVVDTSRKILADTIASNEGKNYSLDMEGEVELTLKDGVSRSFIATSTDYPDGISEVAVAMKNASNEIVGAVIISNFQVTK